MHNYANSNIKVYGEYQLSPRIKLTEGDLFQVRKLKEGKKKARLIKMKFVQYVKNEETGKEWIDAMSMDTYQRHSLSPERITKKLNVKSR